eukprot:Lankesteria_metandrocarpae@DN1225_c0_g1_i1.p1
MAAFQQMWKEQNEMFAKMMFQNQKEKINMKRLGTLRSLAETDLVEFAAWKEDFCQWFRTYLDERVKNEVKKAIQDGEEAVRRSLELNVRESLAVVPKWKCSPHLEGDLAVIADVVFQAMPELV